ncbi:MAG: Crp/Fnr family transcriptional regulator [Zoogloea sp.]|uniref:Crp/Fnr family transcriptional regulator n=1 Tax=Zoogloea sp. TaxID=49181 RepID=UPI0026187507|nr:Crp/Fnr family transcriptional regulator [Zoogloea sp.]MDD2988539.1 Crp/Fnr family transcriptional regulator [Zoogloea sp.]
MNSAPAGEALIALYPILSQLTARARQRLEARAQLVQVPAGTTVFDERQACQGFPFVIAGGIRVVKAAPNGRELPLYRVTPGETCIISSACLLGQAPYNARGVTEADTTLLVVPTEDFQALLGEQAFRDFVFQLFSERIADLMQLIEEVAFRKLDQRLAALLLGKGQRLHTTHQQLADELGSVREIVSRLLKGLAEQGLVALSREQVEILDPAGLRRLAGN